MTINPTKACVRWHTYANVREGGITFRSGGCSATLACTIVLVGPDGLFTISTCSLIRIVVTSDTITWSWGTICQGGPRYGHGKATWGQPYPGHLGVVIQLAHHVPSAVGPLCGPSTEALQGDL